MEQGAWSKEREKPGAIASGSMPHASCSPLARDMRVFDSLLRENVAPHLRAKGARHMRMLNLACGRCDEAETLVKFAEAHAPGDVTLIGADIRIREILQAREHHANLPAEFLLEDATKLGAHKELGRDFDMVVLRHQNFWHDPELWKKIFEQGLDKAGDEGLLVITSYFDKEHRLALDALRKLGADVVLSRRNERSRGLSSPGKSVDKHIAVLRRRK